MSKLDQSAQCLPWGWFNYVYLIHVHHLGVHGIVSVGLYRIEPVISVGPSGPYFANGILS